MKVKKFHCQLLETSHCCPEGTPGETFALRNPKWNGSTNQSQTYATTSPKKEPQTAEVTSKKTIWPPKRGGNTSFCCFFVELYLSHPDFFSAISSCLLRRSEQMQIGGRSSAAMSHLGCHGATTDEAAKVQQVY